MAVTVIRDAANGRTFSGPDDARMYLYSETGRLALAVDIAPREIDYSGIAYDWAEAERSGNKPLLLHKGMSLRAMSFDFMIVDKFDPQVSQVGKIATLQSIAQTFERILVKFSVSEQGLWRIKDLGLNSVYRAEDSDEITRATVSLTLVEASDPAPAVGPVSKPPPPPPAPAPARRTYRVVRGDCLWNIARRFYGNGALWPRIFDANRGKIRDPHWIYPGQEFVIP